MAEKNSLWKNIRNKAKQNKRTGATPKKPSAEMLRQEKKIKAQYATGGPVGDDGLYNMQRALELGYTPDETGHWPSVDSETGMWLKSKEHPTAWMEYMHGYALNPEVQKQYQHPVVNPEGYFGENQLQYNKKAEGGYMYPDGGKTKVYTDPREFRKAERAYNDSLLIYNYSQDNLNWYNKNKYDDTRGVDVEKYADRQSLLMSRKTSDAWGRLKPNPIGSFDTPVYYSSTGEIVGGNGFYLYKKPEVKPVLRKPTVDKLQSKRHSASSPNSKDMTIAGNVQQMPAVSTMEEFQPSKVLIREMGNLDRNRPEGEKGLAEVYMDDGMGWRPVDYNEYKMYKEKYPGSDTPTGWIKNNKKAMGGPVGNGEEYIYTPDTGIEQYAADQSWYEGNPNAADPGNIVSWPSYPNRMMPSTTQPTTSTRSPNYRNFFNRFKKKEEPERVRQYYPIGPPAPSTRAVPIPGPMNRATGGPFNVNDNNPGFETLTESQKALLQKGNNLEKVQGWYEQNPDRMRNFQSFMDEHDADQYLNTDTSNFDEAKKNTNDWYKSWYTKRAQIPRYTEVANKRLGLLNEGNNAQLIDPVNYAFEYWKGTNRENGLTENEVPETFYFPSKMYGSFDPLSNKVFANSRLFDGDLIRDKNGKLISPLLTHEGSHQQEYHNPQIGTTRHLSRNDWNNNNIKDVLQLVVPNEDRIADPGTQGGLYNYYYQPTEVRSRLNVWRQLNDIDPTKDYSNEELKSIIDKNIADPNNSRDIKELYNIIKNDPEKLKTLNDYYVSNKTSPEFVQRASTGGYIYDNGGGVGKDGKAVTLYKKAKYDSNRDKILEYAGSEDNKYYVTPYTPQGIDFESTLPEFEVIKDTRIQPVTEFGPHAPKYISSETGWVQNPNWRGGDALEYVPIESALLAPVAGSIAARAIPTVASALELPAVIGGRTMPLLTAGNTLGVAGGLQGANMLGSDINSGYYASNAPLDEKIARGLETGLLMGTSPGMLSGMGSAYRTVRNPLGKNKKLLPNEFTSNFGQQPSNMDLEELRRVYHNSERFLQQEEARFLYKHGHGLREDYVTNPVSNQLPPPPSEIQFMPDGTTRTIYNQQPIASPQYNLTSLQDDHINMINGRSPVNYPNLSKEENEIIMRGLLNPRYADPRYFNTSNSQIQQAPPIRKVSSSKVKNKSGVTKEEAIAKAPSKNKDKVSKMTDEEFSETILKPNGEVEKYKPGIDVQEMGYDLASRQMILKDAVPITESEYIDRFNSNIDLLNDIIARNNKSGVDYTVVGIDKYGQIKFKTPRQKVNGTEIEGTSQWSVNINPGEWRGKVEDIPNAEYYKSIPGINMSGTSSGVFSDHVPRRGTAAYESINEYLKKLDLGRVKPGFNSQTKYSKGLWENAINKGNAFGYYDNPFTVYGSMKNLFPYAIPTVIGAGALRQSQQQAYGGPTNPYMYYAGGPMEYGNGGKVWKHIGAGAYSLGEGILDTVTGGATDQLTDRGFEALTKLGNKNMDLSDPANARFLKTQQQIKGYGNTTAAVATGIATGNVQGAIQQGAKGLNTAFQASDWASDDFKKWSGISSQAIGIGAGIAGGALNTEGASKGASEAAAKVGEIGGKISPYVNQAVSMFGSNSQPMWQQAQAQQDLLNSPEYAAQQAFNNQQYVNQGLSFARGGTIDPPDGGPGKKPTPKRIIYVDPTTLEGKERYNSYRDSLDVFNNSLNIISYINIPEVNKEKFDEIRSKDLNLDRWSVDEYRYKQDKKNNTVKPLSDYVYSRKKGEKDPIFEAQLERDKASDKNVYTNNVEDFKEVLPDGSIKYPWSVTNGEPDWFMYTVENPYTNTTRFYSNEYWKHKNKKGDIKKDRLLEIASPNIKPIGEKYYASDKLQDQGEINYSSIETKKGSNISDTQTKDSKKWKNYRYDYQDEDIYKEPVEEVRFININKADNTIVPTRTLPQLDKLQPKQYSSYNEQPDIVGSPQQMPPTSPMSADSEGHYRTYKIHTHGEPIYQVWEPGKQWRDVSNEEFEKISGEKYLTEYKSEGGNITNNSLNLQSMKGRYSNYKNRYAKGGTFNQYGIDMIPDSAGLHHENAYGGVPIGPNALGEGGEIKMDTPDGGQYMVSDQVDGAESQKDFTFTKGGKYKELNRTLADGMKQELDKYSFGSLSTNSKLKSDLRRPNDSYAQSTIDQIKQKWQQKTEFARQRNQQEQAIAQAQQQKQLIEEEYIAAYGGRINPKKYPGLNMPKKSKGGYVYNAMTEPMLAMGGPTDPPSNKLISNDKVLGYIADMNERGMLEPGKTFQPSWYSDLEKRQIDLNKELSPVDLGRVKSLYNYKQNNRNIFGFAQGGPMVSNVQQPFNGPAAQNRGGMMMAIGGTIPGPDNDPLSQYEQFYDNKMEGLMKFNPDSSDLGQDILEENNLPFEYRIREPELTNINPRTYPSKVTPGIVGSQQPMPGLSNDATFISPYQKYLAENKPKVLDNLTFLEAEDEDGINFEYGTISNPYRKKSPASNSTTPWYDEPAYSKAARYLPLLTSAAGIATGLKNKKRSLTPERMIPQTVDLERSRITAMEEGRRALDAGLQGNIGSNMGQVAGNTRDMILNYNKNMGAQIAKIYESEANTNAQLAQQAGLANQQAGNQFKINNEEMFQNAQTMALRAAQEGAMLAQSGAEQERKQYLQEWIAKNRLNTRSYKTNIDGKDVYVSPNGQIYDEQGNPVT